MRSNSTVTYLVEVPKQIVLFSIHLHVHVCVYYSRELYRPFVLTLPVAAKMSYIKNSCTRSMDIRGYVP